ncbi:riboflavin synthase [Pyramidobacter piscolens]|uniref:Riboflavin synthase n=1 Tax=Pyramidobacter piscolens W5455 TaxID=352165 RepID=A0ABM9ZSJ2_9BACT|nr:riboflavin synthase [Pyramidobacter piscolens]EFB89796.1 riboflavin synthase, alpha subunit [Pyramidobacter piscolens W5455]BDF78177.1 riboflavin synthase subunit alpha [Pyramidobacter piscolens]
MFTGLVEAVGTIVAVSRRGDVTVFRVGAPFAGELKRGESVAVSGVCTTVTERDGASFAVELTGETMNASRFSFVTTGERVNLERALPADGRLDGHFVAGHVDGTALVMSLRRGRHAADLWLNLPQDLARYVVRKGSLCVDGVSLTVAAVEGNACSVAVIPETLARTTLGTLAAGKKVNVETDLIARYVEKLMGLEAPRDASKTPPELTAERLARMGW